jgi:hypothetical protein
MDIRRKTCDIRKWKKHLFLDVFATTLLHLPNRFSSASKPAAWKPFQCCLSHVRTWLDIICRFRRPVREFLNPVVNRFTRQTLPTISTKPFSMNIHCIEYFAHKRHRIERCSSVIYPSSTAIFTTETSL